MEETLKPKRAYLAAILPDDVFPYGDHITVLYGLPDSIYDDQANFVADVARFLAGKTITVFGRELSYFDNKILKMDVQVPVLEELHYYLRTVYNCNVDFPIYRPHITINKRDATSYEFNQIISTVNDELALSYQFGCVIKTLAYYGQHKLPERPTFFNI